MKTSEIVVGGIYSNGKGRIRKVIAVGDYPLYPGQWDHDCVQYEITNDGTKHNRTKGNKANMTRISFAVWAKERIE